MSYAAGAEKVAYVEPVGVGDALPDMPLFLTPDRYVPCPLEAAYALELVEVPRAARPARAAAPGPSAE